MVLYRFNLSEFPTEKVIALLASAGIDYKLGVFRFNGRYAGCLSGSTGTVLTLTLTDAAGCSFEKVMVGQRQSRRKNRFGSGIFYGRLPRRYSVRPKPRKKEAAVPVLHEIIAAGTHLLPSQKYTKEREREEIAV